MNIAGETLKPRRRTGGGRANGKGRGVGAVSAGVCKNWKDTGTCSFGARCKYAHAGKQAGAANQKQKGGDKPKGVKNLPKSRREREDDSLCLVALGDFGIQSTTVPGALVELVDIGINIKKGTRVQRLLHRSAASGVTRVMLTGTSIKASVQASEAVATHLALDRSNPATKVSLYFTAGVHPHHSGELACSEENLKILSDLHMDPMCVAVGETGLDYDRMKAPREVQLEWFEAQVKLAACARKPLFIHERDLDSHKGAPLGSHDDLCEVLDRYTGEGEGKLRPGQVCVHCFTGTEEEMRDYVGRGYYIGLTGFVAMNKRGKALRDAIQNGALPLSALLAETDSPWMMADQLPKEIGVKGRDNEPCTVPAVVRAVAEAGGWTAEEVALASTNNAIEIFGLPATYPDESTGTACTAGTACTGAGTGTGARSRVTARIAAATGAGGAGDAGGAGAGDSSASLSAPSLFRSNKDKVKLSKALSNVLRHKAQSCGLTVRADGYLPLHRVLSLKQFRGAFKGVTVEMVQEVVRTNDKQRFSLTQEEGGVQLIRANQGHTIKSVQSDQLLRRVTDPSECGKCVHGTSYAAWSMIKSTGLNRMGRNHVHMALDLPPKDNDKDDKVDVKNGDKNGDKNGISTGGSGGSGGSPGVGVISGARSSSQVFVYVDAAKVIASGLKIFLSSNGVVLCEGDSDGLIPCNCFVCAIDAKTGDVIFGAQPPGEAAQPPLAPLQ